MTPSEMLPHLQAWQAAMQAADKAVTTYLDPLRLWPESPVYQTIWRLQDALTAATSLAVGDKCGWLAWYALETHFGREKREAGIKGKHCQISSLKSLAKAIAETRE